jgi:flagellar hook assembly protein FlgD
VRVRTLRSGVETAGRHVFVWDGTNTRGSRVASGVYFYRLSTGTSSVTRKMVVVR